MSDQTLLALIHDCFHEDDGIEKLPARLDDARRQGAGLALLPELPLDPWIPARREPRDEDAEEPDGRRQQLLSEAARTAEIGLVGGVIALDPRNGRRHNRALVFDAAGRLVASYDKLHVPSEEGFWESAHYEGGDEPPQRIDAFGLPLGLQICSDLFRPEGSHLLGALGAAAILAPRATPEASYAQWRSIITANAVTSGAYVLSANRPGPEQGVAIGGASLAVGPDGTVLVESTDPVTCVELQRSVVESARREYPGYLPVRAGLYARAWQAVSDR